MTSEPSNEESFGNELDLKIWKTKGARFNAHKRLKGKHDWSIAAIAFLSTYVIIITLINYVPALSLSSDQQDVVAFSAITLSLFILVLSLLEASKNYQVKAEKFHDCGKEMSTLYNELRFVMTSKGASVDVEKKLKEISDQYDDILARCSENHERIDYDLFLTQHPKDFPMNYFVRGKIHIKSMFYSFFPYLFLIVSPLIGFSVVLVLSS